MIVYFWKVLHSYLPFCCIVNYRKCCIFNYWLQKRHQYTEKAKEDLLNKGILGLVFKDRVDLNSFIAEELDIPLNESQAMRKKNGKFKMDIAKEFKIID